MRMYNLIFLLIFSNLGCFMCDQQGLLTRGLSQSYNNERNHNVDQSQGYQGSAQSSSNEGSNRDEQILRFLNRGYAQSYNNEGRNRDDEILALLSRELPRPSSKKTERTQNINQLQKYLLSLEGSTESTSTEQFSTITTLFYG